MSRAEESREASADRPARLRAVFEAHGPFVCRSLRHLGVVEADLDDLLQEVFLVVSKRLDDYEERGRARSWLYSICSRVSRSQRRKAWRRRESASEVELVAEPLQLEHVQNREALALGWKLLQELPVQQREVFVLYEVEDMPMAEIAQALDCPLQTVYSRLYKARERILVQVQRLKAEGGA